MLRSQIRHTKVEQMTNRMGKPVVNQFIIHQTEGYLKRTSQGRVLTPKGWEISGISLQGNTQGGQMDLIES